MITFINIAMEISDFQSDKALLPALLVGSLTLAIFSFYLYFGVQGRDLEHPVHFVVPFPEQCQEGWEGRILDNPSIRV